MRKSTAVLVGALVWAGCGSRDKTEELQQCARWDEAAASEKAGPQNTERKVDASLALAYYSRGDAYGQMSKWDKTLTDWKKGIELEPDNPQGYHFVAWLLATCPKDAVRNGAKAIEYATKACEIVQWTERC